MTETDTEVARYLLDRRSDWGLRAMQGVTTAGDLWFVTLLVVVLGATAVLRTRRWRPLWLPAMAGAGAFVISVTVKLATGRARPAAPFATVEALGDAFPSGHALRAMAVYAALAWLVTAARRSQARQLAAWGVACGLILLVGASRVYLGAHWLTDVLAGYFLGGLWLVLLVRITATSGPTPAQVPEDSWSPHPEPDQPWTEPLAAP